MVNLEGQFPLISLQERSKVQNPSFVSKIVVVRTLIDILKHPREIVKFLQGTVTIKRPLKIVFISNLKPFSKKT